MNKMSLNEIQDQTPNPDLSQHPRSQLPPSQKTENELQLLHMNELTAEQLKYIFRLSNDVQVMSKTHLSNGSSSSSQTQSQEQANLSSNQKQATNSSTSNSDSDNNNNNNNDNGSVNNNDDDSNNNFKVNSKSDMENENNNNNNEQNNHSSQDIVLIYSDCMVDVKQLQQSILPAIEEAATKTNLENLTMVENYPGIDWAVIADSEKPITIHRLASFIFEGALVCFIPKVLGMLAIGIPNIPSRSPEESATEIAIRGARDGFIEDISSNIALIRKRLRTIHLACKNYNLGVQTNTKVALLYMDNLINPHILNTIEKRLDSIHVDQIITIAQLEELVSDPNYFSFPVLDYTGRPDFIIENLTNGRFAIVMDNNPMVIVGPGNLMSMLRSPEDLYFPLIASNIGRFFRFIGLAITVFLPAFYIAITTFHPDQVPFQILATIATTREGLPMEATLEIFLIMSLMELYREATLRMPSAGAQTISVVGGLIIGDASINAGLVSPINVVIAALTIVAGATLINTSLTSTAVLLRFFAFILSSFLGMYGFILSYVLILLAMSRITSFGVPYLAPLAPINIRTFIYTSFTIPFSWMKKRPSQLITQRPKRDE